MANTKVTKSDFGIDFSSLHYDHWLDNVTYIMCFNMENDKQPDEEFVTWLEMEYHADEKRVVYTRVFETTNGFCTDGMNVEDYLFDETKEKLLGIMKEKIGKELILE